MRSREKTKKPIADRWVETLEAICERPEMRRELLWLRAKEKEDEETARDLERLDPEIRARLVAIFEELLSDNVDYGLLQERLFEIRAAELVD